MRGFFVGVLEGDWSGGDLLRVAGRGAEESDGRVHHPGALSDPGRQALRARQQRQWTGRLHPLPNRPAVRATEQEAERTVRDGTLAKGRRP